MPYLTAPSICTCNLQIYNNRFIFFKAFQGYFEIVICSCQYRKTAVIQNRSRFSIIYPFIIAYSIRISIHCQLRCCTVQPLCCFPFYTYRFWSRGYCWHRSCCRFRSCCWFRNCRYFRSECRHWSCCYFRSGCWHRSFRYFRLLSRCCCYFCLLRFFCISGKWYLFISCLRLQRHLICCFILICKFRRKSGCRHYRYT